MGRTPVHTVTCAMHAINDFEHEDDLSQFIWYVNIVDLQLCALNEYRYGSFTDFGTDASDQL